MDTGTLPPTPPPHPAAERPQAVYLEIIFGSETGRRHLLGPDRTLIGRGTEAHFVLDDPTVSRSHVAIEPRGAKWHLTDLGSGNGTRVNGEIRAEATLEEGTTIEIGSTIMEVRFGELPTQKTAATGIRKQDTQKLPVLGREIPEPPPLQATPGKTRPEMRKTSSSRSLTPSPLLAQMISWLVVVALAGGGILLALNLIDSGATLQGDPAESETLSAPRKPRAAPIVLPAAARARPSDNLPAEMPLEDAPDVALEKFGEAGAAEKEGDYETAVAILTEVSRKYPEFQPPGQRTVLERIGDLERRITYAGSLRWGEELLAEEAPAEARLQQLLAELATIPTTDREFGEDAMLLSNRAKVRLREVGRAEEVAPVPTATEGDVQSQDVAAPEEPPAAEPEVATPDRSQDIETTVAKAKELYGDGAFKSASSRLRELAGKLGDSDDAKRLTNLAADIESFERHYEKGKELSRKPGRYAETIAELEKAYRIDRGLFGSFRSRLVGTLADAYAQQAAVALEEGRYQNARDYLDKARSHDRSQREVAKLANLFSFRGAALLRQARKEINPKKARRMGQEALLLADKGSALEKEAKALLSQLEEPLAPSE
jgi:pSer/pThr/pTyr-binding forkhead associated (FHA) protein/tetratricopeptide (TPR) repeat protein